MTNLDLPTAIREGSKLRKQGFGAYFDDEGGSCVFGAAIEAESGEIRAGVLFDVWPELRREIDGANTLFGAMLFLNDLAGWTREEIADWVDMVLP